MDSTPTPENMDRVLAFLPYFENASSHFYDVETDNLSMDPYVYAPEVDRFVGTLYGEGFIFPFDWSAWKDEAARYVAGPSLLDNADLATLRKLLTLHVRADRFNSGHLAGMIDNGHILVILRRLKAIRDASRQEQA